MLKNRVLGRTSFYSQPPPRAPHLLPPGHPRRDQSVLLPSLQVSLFLFGAHRGSQAQPGGGWQRCGGVDAVVTVQVVWWLQCG